MEVDLYRVQCPHCFEFFDISLVSSEVLGSEIDYDCEVCCRPMVICLNEGGLSAFSLDDL